MSKSPANDRTLDLADLDPDPIGQFRVWFEAAQGLGLEEPHAMTLATVSGDGRPSARTVLLKGVDARGFVFFTNYGSRKAQDLEENPRAALVFYWPPLKRQVLVHGSVTRTTVDEAEGYFRTRPRGSQLGAWASRQSEVLPDRETLEHRVAELAARFAGQEVPLPPFWGGFRLVPDAIEFWQGRADRLHDRFRYRRAGRRWIIERLSP